jgi:hypothetical protein
MITTLALELVSLLRSFIGVGAETMRRIVSSGQLYPLGNPVGRGQQGSPRAAHLMQKDTTMTLHFAPTLSLTSYESYDQALAIPALHDGSDRIRLDANDWRARRRLPAVAANSATAAEGRQP